MSGQAILFVKDDSSPVTAWAAATYGAGSVHDGVTGVYVEYRKFAEVLSDKTSKGDDAVGRVAAHEGHLTLIQLAGLALCWGGLKPGGWDEAGERDPAGLYDYDRGLSLQGEAEFAAATLACLTSYNRGWVQRGWNRDGWNQTWVEGACAAADHPTELKKLEGRARMYTALTANALTDNNWEAVTAAGLQIVFDTIRRLDPHDVGVGVGVVTKLIRAGFHPSEFGGPGVEAALANPETLEVMAELRQRTAAA